MMTVAQALQHFISGLELSAAEKRKVVKQKEEVRGHLRAGLTLREEFLSGSYARNTAIRPLNDVDIFVVLDERVHGDLYQGGPSKCLKEVRAVLDKAYPNKELPILQNRSVHIEFAGTGIEYDVVPAFAELDGDGGDNYLVPDRDTGTWIRSNPRIHKEFSTKCNERAGKKLKPLVKAIKRWNAERGKPLRSFHVEVMCCDVLTSPPDSYIDGLSTLFHGLKSAVDRPCHEPAGIGPDLDADMTPGKRQHAREIFGAAAKDVDKAIDYANNGLTARAHYLLRALFGSDYPEKGSAGSSGSQAPTVITGGSVDSGGHRYG